MQDTTGTRSTSLQLEVLISSSSGHGFKQLEDRLRHGSGLKLLLGLGSPAGNVAVTDFTSGAWVGLDYREHPTSEKIRMFGLQARARGQRGQRGQGFGSGRLALKEAQGSSLQKPGRRNR